MSMRLWGICCLAVNTALADATCWQTDMSDSHLTFTGIQAGAEFTGEFKTFEATICFAPDELDSSHFNVNITIASADTRNSDRDDTLQSSDFFDVKRWPTAHYETQNFQRNGMQYTADGVLTLRDTSRSVPTTFRFIPGDEGTARLAGRATVQRLDFGIGQGEWRDTTWVGNTVKIEYSLALKPNK